MASHDPDMVLADGHGHGHAPPRRAVHRALLAHLADAIDRGAARYVYGPCRPAARNGPTAPAQRVRWRELCAVFGSKGLTPSDVARITGAALRDEHGPIMLTAQQTSVAEMHARARQVLEPRELLHYQRLLALVPPTHVHVS